MCKEDLQQSTALTFFLCQLTAMKYRRLKESVMDQESEGATAKQDKSKKKLAAKVTKTVYRCLVERPAEVVQDNASVKMAVVGMIHV